MTVSLTSPCDVEWGKLVFLIRAAARHALVEAGAISIDEAFDGLLPMLETLIEDCRDCECACEIGRAWERHPRGHGARR